MRKTALLLALLGFVFSSMAQDTTRSRRRGIDTSIFNSADTLTGSDYLLAIERSYQYFNKVHAVTGSFASLESISRRMRDDDSVLAIMRRRVDNTSRTVNIRNLQMYAALLSHMDLDEDKFYSRLTDYEARMDSLKLEFSRLRKDSTLRGLFRDSLLRARFRPQLTGLRTKRREADSVFRSTNEQVNNLKAHVTTNRIAVEELQNKVNELLRFAGARAFSKERRYIWEPRNGTSRRTNVGAEFRRGLKQENRIAQYYFANTRSERLILLLLGSAFFAWVAFNYRTIRSEGVARPETQLPFRFLKPWPVMASVLFILNLAPLFDLNAPALYVETIGLLLMATLSVFFFHYQRRVFFGYWCVFIVLFLLYSFSRFLGLPYSMQRFWNLGINLASIALAMVVIRQFRNFLRENRLTGLAVVLFVTLHLLAALSNIFGRVTLSQLFSSTAIYSLAQTIGLAIFVPAVSEAILLHIQASRIRNQYPAAFDFNAVHRKVQKAVLALAVVIWLVVFTTNMNMYNALSGALGSLLSAPRSIGSFHFTIAGALLFLGIIWLAHFLQKYIAYFWGDTGDEAEFDNKGHRSRLLITRLIVLVGGFLLAVAASGLPVDKITVILGALGVGIGLGLQGIVNNFVSGIILIFDRPLRIGDMVEIGDKKGRVKEIGVRSSTLLTAEGAEVIIPNGDLLSQNIVNWTLSNNHARIELGFELDREISGNGFPASLREKILAVPGMLSSREPQVVLEPLDGGKYELLIYAWCADVNNLQSTRSQLRKAIQDYLSHSTS